jgi:hypothetical protein
MPRLSVAAGMISKTSFFKDVSHFKTMFQIALFHTDRKMTLQNMLMRRYPW